MKLGTTAGRPSPTPSLEALNASSSPSSASSSSSSASSAAPATSASFASRVAPGAATGPAPDARRPEGPSAFARVLRGLASNIERGEGVAERVAKGQEVASDPASLLALQAGMYRYVEAVDLASKLVDRATGAVKTVLQSQ